MLTAATRPWAYACEPVSPTIGTIVRPCGTSMMSPAAHTPGTDVRMWSSTTIAPVVPRFNPAASASAVFGTLCSPSTTASHSNRPAEVERYAARLQGLVHGLGDVRVEHLVEHPGALVDEIDLQPAMAEVARHLDRDRA